MNDIIFTIWGIICVLLIFLVLIMMFDINYKIIKTLNIRVIIGLTCCISLIGFAISRSIYDGKPINKHKVLVNNIESAERNLEKTKRELEKFYIDYPQFKENE